MRRRQNSEFPIREECKKNTTCVLGLFVNMALFSSMGEVVSNPITPHCRAMSITGYAYTTWHFYDTIVL